MVVFCGLREVAFLTIVPLLQEHILGHVHVLSKEMGWIGRRADITTDGSGWVQPSQAVLSAAFQLAYDRGRGQTLEQAYQGCSAIGVVSFGAAFAISPMMPFVHSVS